jgi:ankyrin repeat protein
LDVIRFLVQSGASIEARDQNQNTPLDTAADQGHLDVVGFLEMNLLLLKASCEGDIGQVNQAIDGGAYLNVHGDGNTKPLHLAARYGHEVVVDLLLTSNADFDPRNDDKRTPLHLAARYGHGAVVDILLKFKAAVDVRDCDKMTPLHLAAEKGHEAIVHSLLKSKADVNALTGNNKTPLRFAVDHGHANVTKMLLDADANFVTREMIDLAIQRGYVGVASLLECRLHTNSVDLIRAALLPEPAFIQSLIDQGVNINLVFKDENSNWRMLEGKTALHVAAASTGDMDVIRLLLDAGADRTVRDSNGNTAAQLAVEHQHYDAAKLLKHDQCA